ncbi:unnamed protein product [Lota lota]
MSLSVESERHVKGPLSRDMSDRITQNSLCVPQAPFPPHCSRGSGRPPVSRVMQRTHRRDQGKMWDEEDEEESGRGQRTIGKSTCEARDKEEIDVEDLRAVWTSGKTVRCRLVKSLQAICLWLPRGRQGPLIDKVPMQEPQSSFDEIRTWDFLKWWSREE